MPNFLSNLLDNCAKFLRAKLIFFCWMYSLTNGEISALIHSFFILKNISPSYWCNILIVEIWEMECYNTHFAMWGCSELRHFLGLDLDILETQSSKCLPLKRDYKPVPFCVHYCQMLACIISVSCYIQPHLIS